MGPGYSHTKPSTCPIVGVTLLSSAPRSFLPAIIQPGTRQKAAILFRGVGHSLNAANSHILKVLTASPSAYSANPNTKLSSPPTLTGSAISLVSIVQAASNLVAGNNLEETIQQLIDMGGGSWDRETVTRALRAV